MLLAMTSIGRCSMQGPSQGNPADSAAKFKGRQKSGGLCLRKSRGRRDYRLGLGAVLCAELGVSCPCVLVIRRTSTRRFLARPSAVAFGATYLSLPIPIRYIL